MSSLKVVLEYNSEVILTDISGEILEEIIERGLGGFLETIIPGILIILRKEFLKEFQNESMKELLHTC